MKPSKSSTPRPSERAVSVPPLRRNHQTLLHKRAAGHAAKIFCPLLYAIARCGESPQAAGVGVFLRLPVARRGSQVHDRERNGHARHFPSVGRARQREYAVARHGRLPPPHRCRPQACRHRPCRNHDPIPPAPVRRLLPWPTCSLAWDEVCNFRSAPELQQESGA